jgi:hypothetical protein
MRSSYPCAVMKIAGTLQLLATSCRWRSMPLMPGRRTSNMRQSALRGCAEFKKSSAEANTLTSRPADLIRLSSDSRTEISSSTTAARGAIAVTHLMDTTGQRKNLLHLGTRFGCLSPAARRSLQEGTEFPIVDTGLGLTAYASGSPGSPPSSPDLPENRRAFCASHARDES